MVNDLSSLPDLPSLLSRLREWARVGAIADIDRHLAEFVARHQKGGGGVESVLSACILSWMGARGHTCLYLEELAGQAFPFEGSTADYLRLPDQETWCRALAQNTAVAVVENYAPQVRVSPLPMILAGNARLYWHRLWVYEEEVATRLLCLANSPLPYDLSLAQRCLFALFPSRERTASRRGASLTITIDDDNGRTGYRKNPGSGPDSYRFATHETPSGGGKARISLSPGCSHWQGGCEATCFPCQCLGYFSGE